MDTAHPKITVPPILKPAHGKPPFNYGCLSEIPHLDPLAKTFDPFAWDEVSRLLGEEVSAEDLAAATKDIDRQGLCRALATVFGWCLREKQLHRIGRRLVAVMWVVNPGFFNGASANKVAESFGLHNTRLHEVTGEASREFGIRGKAQLHAHNWSPTDKLPTAPE